MKLKYYLRGIGIGVVVTTIIFMISISIHKNDMESQKVPTQNSESKTVAEVQNSTQEVSDTTAVEDTQQTKETIAKNTETEETSEAKNANENTETENSEAKNSKTVKAAENKENISEEKPLASAAAGEKIRFEVGRGEYSDVICRKLAEAGLIDDADAFNKFLIQENYDNFILPGVYDIPKGSTYEEIAVLLTTKVEKETAVQ